MHVFSSTSSGIYDEKKAECERVGSASTIISNSLIFPSVCNSSSVDVEIQRVERRAASTRFDGHSALCIIIQTCGKIDASDTRSTSFFEPAVRGVPATPED